MSGVEILNAVLEIVVGGIGQVATAIGTGLSTLVTQIFLTGTGDSQTISTFGVVVLVFAGVSLALGLSRWVLNFITSLGANNN